MNQNSQHNLIIIEGRATYEQLQSKLGEMDNEEAIPLVQNFIRVYPEFAQAQNDLGVLYYQSGNSLKALAHYEKAHKLDPANVTYRKNLADFYFVELEWADDALQLYRDILKDNPYDTEVLNALGTISQRSGRRKQARGYFERTLQIDSRNSAAQEALQSLGGQLTSATQQLQIPVTEPRNRTETINTPADFSAPLPRQTPSASFAEQRPNPDQLYRQALEASNSGNTREARRLLEDLVACDPGYAVAHNDLGVVYQREGDLLRARQYHEKAVRLQPDSLLFRKNLADLLYIGLGETAEALRLYIEILQAAPRDVEVLKALANICISMGKFDDARSFTEKILKVEPWNSEARESLAIIAKAGKTQKESPAARPGADEIHAEALRLTQNDRINEAQSMLEELVHHYPDHALGYNDLGVLRYRLGDVEGARSAYERAVDLQPHNSNFRKNLADLYFAELGRVDDAIRIYLDLFRLQPRDLETLVGLGQICATVGRPEEAKSFYRRALEIEPWNAEVRDALRDT